ncbi:MAG: cytochrome c [Gammaproteobacteria bacterium]|nr:cytochrome c [Gammaproteobacteria bacterium]MBU1722338.1 cytochrome c [Gammaproteobacteria bacterium]MBU2004725.1 cytochrome c [Gammaproteobacteria bacterium]
MKKMTILLPLVLAFTLTACGEKKTDTAAAPDAAKPAEQAATPASAAPAATETAQAPAAGDHPGKAIHDANCISCHDSGVYTRADRKMQDFAMLSAQVRRCDANLGSKLFDEDMDKIAAYLNDSYYHFPK